MRTHWIIGEDPERRMIRLAPPTKSPRITMGGTDLIGTKPSPRLHRGYSAPIMKQPRCSDGSHRSSKVCASDSSPTVSLSVCTAESKESRDVTNAGDVNAAAAAMVEKLLLGNGHSLFRGDSMKERLKCYQQHQPKGKQMLQLVPLMHEHPSSDLSQYYDDSNYVSKSTSPYRARFNSADYSSACTDVEHDHSSQEQPLMLFTCKRNITNTNRAYAAGCNATSAVGSPPDSDNTPAPGRATSASSLKRKTGVNIKIKLNDTEETSPPPGGSDNTKLASQHNTCCVHHVDETISTGGGNVTVGISHFRRNSGDSLHNSPGDDCEGPDCCHGAGTMTTLSNRPLSEETSV